MTFYTIRAEFKPKVKYTFWIVARNTLSLSGNSKTAELLFDGDSVFNDRIKGLRIVNVASDKDRGNLFGSSLSNFFIIVA